MSRQSAPTPRPSRRRRLFRILPSFALALSAGACGPQFLPFPVTETATTLPATETPAPMGAPIIDAPALVALRMFNETEDGASAIQQSSALLMEASPGTT